MTTNMSNSSTQPPLTVETSYIYELLLHVFGIPLVISMLTINILLIVVVAKNPSLQLKAMNVIISWTIADILMAAMLLSRIVVGSSLWSYSDHRAVCHAWNSLLLFPLIMCFSHVLIVALCRYAAVNTTVFYDNHLTVLKLRLYISGGWCYGFLLSLIPMGWKNDTGDAWPCSMFLLPRGLVAMLLGLHFWPCLCIAAFLFARMFISVSRHKRQVHVTNTISEQKLDEDVHLAKTFMYMCTLYFFFWIPFLVVQTAWAIKEQRKPSKSLILPVCTLVCLLLLSSPLSGSAGISAYELL